MTAFADLPILFTEDYSEVTEEYLEECWHAMSGRVFEYRAMLKSWYFRHFLDKVALLREPRFVCWKFAGTPSEKFHEVLDRSSRSAADIVVETPKAPFTRGAGPMAAEAKWQAAGNLQLRSEQESLHIRWTGDEALAQFPFWTMEGAQFRLSGSIKVRTAGATLLIEIADSVGALERAAVRDDVDISLKFLARSDRTVLSLRPASQGERPSWTFHGLTLIAKV